MKLSQLLDKYYVLSPQSEICGYDHFLAADRFRISWASEDLDYEAMFDDQTIRPVKGCPGLFTVTDVEGEAVQFTALMPADLEEGC